VLGGFRKVTCMIVSLVFTMKTIEYQNLWWDQDENQLVSSHPCENQPFLFFIEIKNFMTFSFFFHLCVFQLCESMFYVKLWVFKVEWLKFCAFYDLWGFRCELFVFDSIVHEFCCFESLRFGIRELLLFMNFVDVHHCLMLLFCHLISYCYCLSLSLVIVFAINYSSYLSLPSTIIVIIEP
jgi:hypothetical protein